MSELTHNDMDVATMKDLVKAATEGAIEAVMGTMMRVVLANATNPVMFDEQQLAEPSTSISAKVPEDKKKNAVEAKKVSLPDPKVAAKIALAAKAAQPSQNENKAPYGGVGELANTCLRQGMTNEEVLAKIREEYPHARTSMASVSWYRSQLRNAGEPVPTAKELRLQRESSAA